MLSETFVNTTQPCRGATSVVIPSKVYGKWPGLSADELYQGRDLAVTTDFRDVISAVLERHMKLDDRQLQAVFPGFPPAPTAPEIM